MHHTSNKVQSKRKKEVIVIHTEIFRAWSNILNQAVGTVMQIEKALINDRLRVLKVP